MLKKIILVDEKDREIGWEEKIKAHKEGKLHRAFSIFLFNSRGEMLLQKRAKTKYHSPGLWTNTCCSHPRPNKNLEEETKRRLKEEMGINCQMKKIFSFIYKVNLGKLMEHEFNHVFIGKFDGKPKASSEEVDDWKWINAKELKKEMRKKPEKYAYWFRLILDRVLKIYQT